jgi:hypothetical protein
MANNINWGQGAINNNIGWGQGAKNNSIGWGLSQFTSPAGETEIYGARSDADASAFLSATAITDATIQGAVNTLVTDLKSAGVWAKMKAIYPFCGGTPTTHKYNLKDPRDLDIAFRLGFNGGITHSVTGALPNGTTGYANTFFVPSAILSNESIHFSSYYRTDLDSPSLEFGCTIFADVGENQYITNQHFITPNAKTDLFYANGGSSQDVFSVSNNIGSYIVSRTGVNSTSVYKNATLSDSNTFTSGNANGQLFLLGKNNLYLDDTPSQVIGYGKKQIAFATIGDGLNSTESLNLYNAIQTFQTTLGRSIGPQVVSDADAQAFVTSANIIDQVQAKAINDLVIGMKADGTWTKMKAVYPFVGGNATSHSYNLKNTALHQITWFGGLTHDANGVTPNGTNGYGNLNFNPRTHLGTQSSMGTYIRVNNTASGKVDYGSSNLDGFQNACLITSFGNLIYFQNIGSGNDITTPNATTNAFFHTGVDTSNNIFAYKNNTLMLSKPAVVIGTPPNVNTALFAFNAGGANSFSPRPSSFFFAASGTTQADNASIYSRIQAFQTTLGRQV